MKNILLFFAFITLLFSCSSDDSEDTTPLIGDTFQGGIVFYLNDNGGGLIAATTDQSSAAEWGCESTTISGADGTAIGTGAQNTIDIETECTTTGTAADLCANLTLGGYSDWFLPSKNELDLMYENIGQGNTSGLGNSGNFVDDYYWSSTEVDFDNGDGWAKFFPNGGNYDTYKSYTTNVRAVRAF